MSAEEVAPPPVPKVDPETMAIRAKPRRPIRFRRGVIVAISALGSISLIAVTWMALKPAVFRQVAQEEELSQPARQAPDALNGVPATYGDVPKLGPPLPGDLGRPILERQRQLAAETQAPMPIPTSPDAAAQNAAAEQERLLAARRAARESALLVSRSQSGVGGEQSASTGSGPVPAATPARPLDPAGDPNAQRRKADFVATLDPKGDTDPHAVMPAPSPYALMAGSIISASLITGLRSDLPGLITAQVTERVYDSPTGRTLLIPQGARLVGTYDSVLAFGQRRALIV